MGILRRLVDAFDPPLERRDSDGKVTTWDLLSADLGSGSAVNPRIAENLGTVTACVAAIATAIASLPAYVYRRVGKGRELDDKHPLARLIADGPNDHQSWADWLEWTVASALLRGNALAPMIVDNAGAVKELKPVPWEYVSPQLLASGRIAYDIVEITSIFGGSGLPRRVLEGEAFHLRDRSDDGLIGRSRLSRAAATFRAGVALADFNASMWKNGVHPSGILMAEKKLSDERIKSLSEHFRGIFAGTSNAARVIVADSGLKWESISVSPEDAELLASRRFTTEELARIFAVPPPLVGIWDHSSFTNSETAGRWFAQFTLSPWVRKIEAEFQRSVFSATDRLTHFLEIDLSALLRGDPEARWRSHEIALKNGVLTPNEVREVEGWNPRAGGDKPIEASPAPAAAAA